MPETRGSTARAQAAGQLQSAAGPPGQHTAGQATAARAVTPAALNRPATAGRSPVLTGNTRLMGSGHPTAQSPPVSIQAIMTTMGEMKMHITSLESTVHAISQAVRHVQEYQQLVEKTSSQCAWIEQLEKESQQLQETSKRDMLSLRKEKDEWKTKTTQAGKKAAALEVQIKEISREHTEDKTEFQEDAVAHNPEVERSDWSYKIYAAAVKAMPPKARKAYNKVVAPPSDRMMTVCLSGLRGKISAIRSVLADYGLPTRAIVNIECIQMNQILLTAPRCYTTELMEAITRLRGVKHEKENTNVFVESSLYTKEEMEQIHHRIETILSMRIGRVVSQSEKFLAVVGHKTNKL
ncbi:hypothetical protein GQ54DRAFT_324207 [Martensiomyces pterosporus]|nr:hypothetical protein GQ54DRAFT_324207 [Martensiomyces pterosporus]